MKTSFNFFAFLFLFITVSYMNYKLSQVGVPDALILILSISYMLLFPWRMFTIEKEGDSSHDDNETSK